MAATADTGLTVLIASHVVSELERLCDWLIVLTSGQVRLARPVDDLLAVHRLLTVPRATQDADLPGQCIHRADSDRHSTALVRADPAGMAAARPRMAGRARGLRAACLAYLQRPHPTAAQDDPARAAARPGPTTKAVAR